MKKALMAAALFAAVTSASATTVSVYGVMDMGVSVSKKSGATGDNRWNLQMKSVFVKILQKNWLGVFLPLKNLSRGFAPTLRYPRIFFKHE